MLSGSQSPGEPPDLGLGETVGGEQGRDKRQARGDIAGQRQKGQADDTYSEGARGGCGVTGGCLPCLLFAGQPRTLKTSAKHQLCP